MTPRHQAWSLSVQHLAGNMFIKSKVQERLVTG